MAFEDNIYQLRQEKLRQIEALGQQSYPHKFETDQTVTEVLAAYGEKTAEQLADSRVRPEGDLSETGPTVLHRLMPRSRSVSLHIYRPPLRTKL